jgi:hypothetical protein
MARTFHSRPVKGTRNRRREDVTATRQPRPALRRTHTRQAFIAAAVKGI